MLGFSDCLGRCDSSVWPDSKFVNGAVLPIAESGVGYLCEVPHRALRASSELCNLFGSVILRGYSSGIVENDVGPGQGSEEKILLAYGLLVEYRSSRQICWGVLPLVIAGYVLTAAAPILTSIAKFSYSDP